MANLIEVTDTTVIKPLNGAVVRRYTAGAAVTAGYPVYLDSSGYVRIASATAVSTNFVLGVAIKAIASGDMGPIVVKGPILCLTGATPGGKLYTMTSAGGMHHAAGTKVTVVGVAETATILNVSPRMVSFS